MMEKNENLKLIFTGSFVEAKYIKQYLEDNNIDSLVRDTINESIIAGWASGAPEDAGLVFVFKNDYEKAKKLVENYKNDNSEKSD